MIALLESYFKEWISPDIHYLAGMRAVGRSVEMGVTDEEAREIVGKLLNHAQNKREQVSQNQLTKAEMSVDYWTLRIRNVTELPVRTKYYTYDTR